jgi:hypothetical protein
VSTYGVPIGFSYRKLALLLVCVVLVAMSLAWTFLSMRAVMYVGGSCADGGPYVSAQPCPSGGGFIGLAIPLLVVSGLVGSVVAAALPAPNLLVPMWAVLFGSLGWNFLQFGFGGQPGGGTQNPGWIVCGVVFELMAAPAVVALVVGLTGRSTMVDPAGTPPIGSRGWWAIYLVLGLAGTALGAATFYALF